MANAAVATQPPPGAWCGPGRLPSSRCGCVPAQAGLRARVPGELVSPLLPTLPWGGPGSQGGTEGETAGPCWETNPLQAGREEPVARCC